MSPAGSAAAHSAGKGSVHEAAFFAPQPEGTGAQKDAPGLRQCTRRPQRPGWGRGAWLVTSCPGLSATSPGRGVSGFQPRPQLHVQPLLTPAIWKPLPDSLVTPLLSRKGPGT